jgi:hypothetical protein
MKAIGLVSAPFAIGSPTRRPKSLEPRSFRPGRSLTSREAALAVASITEWLGSRLTAAAQGHQLFSLRKRKRISLVIHNRKIGRQNQRSILSTTND